MNPHLGPRFVADRRISLFTVSNQFGSAQIWFKMKSSMCRFADDLHAPNIAKILLTAGLTAVKTQLEADSKAHMASGGTMMGCFSWQECKLATMSRCVDYGTIAGCGVAAGLLCIVAGISAGMGLICMGKEGHVKKKKKKIEAEWNTCLAGMVCFANLFIAVNVFICITLAYFNSFKEISFYPFPYVSVGSYMGGFAAFLMFVGMISGYRRQSIIQDPDGEHDHKHGKHSHHHDDDGSDHGHEGGGDDGGGEGGEEHHHKKKKKHKHH